MMILLDNQSINNSIDLITTTHDSISVETMFKSYKKIIVLKVIATVAMSSTKGWIGASRQKARDEVIQLKFFSLLSHEKQIPIY